jgi:hypothetical protein
VSSVPVVDYQQRYLHQNIADFLQQCQSAAGHLMRRDSIGTTPEGRQIWMATITDFSTGAPEDKPAYYVQANIHSHETYTTSAALHLIHALVTSSEVRELLRKVTFYVVPRANPDGGEYHLNTLSWVRSRVEVSPKPNGVIPQDLNGDGLILNMRWEDPAGPLALHPEDDRILVPRRPGDSGPFYHEAVEGLIHEYDGGPLVDGVTHYDYNRNYPIRWSHTADRARYPFEHADLRAIGDFLLSHPNIFAGQDFHGGTPSILCPSSLPNQELTTGDLELIVEMGKLGERLTGLSVKIPEKPVGLPGSSKDFAHYTLGISWYIIEVGSMYSTAGIGPDETVDALSETRERDFTQRIMQFSDEHADTDSRVMFVPWEDYDHPQLGRVQIGGQSRASKPFGHAYLPKMEQISAGISSFILQHATYHPELMLSGCEAVAVAPQLYRIRGRAANIGHLATNVMSTGLQSRIHQPVRVTIEQADDIEVLSRPRVYEFASLGGGGDFRPVEWFISATSGSEITMQATHPRGGSSRHTLTLP